MRIILVQPQEPGNIGSAARVMKNFGLSDLWLVKPQCQLSKEAYYMATHAKDIVAAATIVETTREAVSDRHTVIGTTARKRRSDAFDIYTPRDAAQTFTRDRLAIMFGPETSGLSNEDLEYCHAYIRIPTSEATSMNLAQAVNLISYEFFVTDAPNHSKQPDDPASREDLERLHERFMLMAHHIQYTKANAEAKAHHMYRRIFDRARLTKREVHALHGLWRQVNWAADQPKATRKRLEPELEPLDGES